MNFFKQFFNDESTIIGLCGFETMKPNYNKNLADNNFFFNSFLTEKTFETNLKKNILLSI